ncbi:MAG: VOC family protein [Myxococcales bacterium]|nr:VOC family protein [Myxococcales bacterium]
MGNPFCFVELHTNDTERAKEFYTQLVNWKAQDMKMSDGLYTIFHVGDGVPGGLKAAEPGRPPHWLSFIEVDDVNQYLAKAQKLGAKVTKGATHIPGFGWYGVIIDPTGAEVGLWKRGD